MAMNERAFAIVALIAFGSTAHAMGGGLSRLVSCITRFPHGMTQAQVNGITEGMGPTNSSCLVRSPADCEPQAAEIVWGPHQELVGFSCYSNANGS